MASATASAGAVSAGGELPLAPGSDAGSGGGVVGELGSAGTFSELFAGGAGAGAGAGASGGLGAESSSEPVVVFEEGPCTKALNESKADSRVSDFEAFDSGDAGGILTPLEAADDEGDDGEEAGEEAGVDASSILKRPFGMTTSSPVLRLRKRPDT